MSCGGDSYWFKLLVCRTLWRGEKFWNRSWVKMGGINLNTFSKNKVYSSGLQEYLVASELHCTLFRTLIWSYDFERVKLRFSKRHSFTNSLQYWLVMTAVNMQFLLNLWSMCSHWSRHTWLDSTICWMLRLRICWMLCLRICW